MEVMGIFEEKDPTAKFIKCKNCKKKFTQTIHKGKKSLPICPYCGSHNSDTKKEIEETIETFDSVKTPTRRRIYDLENVVIQICNLFVDGFVSKKSFCKNFPSFEIFLNSVKNVIMDRLSRSSFGSYEDSEEFSVYFRETIEQIYGQQIKNFYQKNCGQKH